jgi:RHS repeat-associated protein
VAPNTPATGDKSLQYRYDAHHRRVTRTIQEWTGTAWASTGTTHFIYDGWNVIEEYTLTSSTSTLAKTYTWGLDLSGSLQGAGGVGALLMAEEVSGSTTLAYHFHYDGNGNVTEITDATGAQAASYRYDAFGNTLIAAGTYAATNRYRFSTKPLDAEVANAPLYYYGYRYFDPATGRWPSRDPIEEAGGLNLYGFAGDSAVNLIDILGLNGQLAPIPSPSPSGGNLPSNVIRGPWAPRALPAAGTASPGALAIGGVALLGAVTVVAGVYTLFEIEEAIESARRLRELERESSQRKIWCVYHRYGQPLGTSETPLEHGGTCGGTCIYRCQNNAILLVTGLSSASECPYSNPKRLVEYRELLPFASGELPRF